MEKAKGLDIGEDEQKATVILESEIGTLWTKRLGKLSLLIMEDGIGEKVVPISDELRELLEKELIATSEEAE